MTLTEKEAEEKWCPFMRKDQNWFPNGDPPGGAGPECMGSRCMAWRWHRPTSTEIAHTEDERIVSHGHVSYREKPPEGSGWRKIVQVEGEWPNQKILPPHNVGISVWERPTYGAGFIGAHSARGYCGLAGKP